MKGIIFTEFLDMVESKFSANMVDDMIDDANVPSGGAYTAIGTYPHEEIVSLVVSLSKLSGLEIPVLVRTFGHHMFKRFHHLYPRFFRDVTDAFQFLESVHDYIHIEVHKLYPDAELPAFATQRVNEKELIMTYRSAHPFATLAEGLIQGCLDHFGVTATITRHDLDNGAGTHAEFHIERA